MKNTFAIFVSLAFGFTIAYGNLTIEDCYKLARENYPAIKQFELIKRTESYTLENANTKYLPQVSASANAVYLSDSPSMMGASIIPQDQYHMQLTATQTIWDGGTTQAKKKITRAEAKTELDRNETIIYAIRGRINRLFFGALLQSESIRQNEIYQSDISTAIVEIKTRIENGVANEYDLSMLEVELLKAKQTKTTLESNCNTYLKLLSLFIGNRIDKVDELEMPKPLSCKSQEIMRPELAYYSALEDAHEARKDDVNAGLMPKIGLFGTAGYGRTNFDVARNDFDFYGLVGIQLSLSFSDWYTEANEKMKIAESKKRVAADRETFIFNAKLDATQQSGEVDKYQKLIDSDVDILRLRTLIKNVSFSRLKNGVITSRDYIRDLNAYDIVAQDAILHKIQKLSAEYEYKFITNN